MHGCGRSATSCLILAHGAGSTAEFLARAFPPQRCAADTRYIDDRTGSAKVAAQRIGEVVDRLRPHYARLLVGGVSIGAHAAAMVSSARPGVVDGCVLALPAWSGQPDPAGPTAMAAAEVERHGAASVLSRLSGDDHLASDWVLAELRRAWADRPTLPAELRRAAGEPGPHERDLRRLPAPTLVLAMTDDPFHPVELAHRWASIIPNARLTVLDRRAPGVRRDAFGAAVGRWAAAPTGPRAVPIGEAGHPRGFTELR